MGKWTHACYDDLLASKIKTLISGAIARSKLETNEPATSYEKFVEDLDVGDSFTTTVVELLVKELAERRSRGVGGDRKLIAERTSRGLSQLAGSRVHRPQRRHSLLRDRGRTESLTEYLRSPPEELSVAEDEDGEEFEHILDHHIEGARTNPELYDAYVNGGQPPWVAPSSFFPRTTTTSDAPPSVPTPPRDASPPLMRRTQSRIFPTSSVQRQPTVRRPTARRTVDFNEFASRRRSTFREGQNQSSSALYERPRGYPYNQPPIWTTSVWTEDDEAGPSDPPPSTWVGPIYHPPAPRTMSSLEDPSADSLTAHVHRPLRRGGLRAPESLSSRHDSPVPRAPRMTPATAALTHLPLPAIPEPIIIPQPEEPESTAYPTPGPQENDIA